jgi:hypothetical protein
MKEHTVYMTAEDIDGLVERLYYLGIQRDRTMRDLQNNWDDEPMRAMYQKQGMRVEAKRRELLKALKQALEVF